MSEYKKSHNLSALQASVEHRTSTKGSTAPDVLLQRKLHEDDLYTLLHAYVRKFAPTPNLMLYGEESSEADIKRMIADTSDTLKKSFGVDLTPEVKRVKELVRQQQYKQAIAYIRKRSEAVEREIRALQ